VGNWPVSSPSHTIKQPAHIKASICEYITHGGHTTTIKVEERLGLDEDYDIAGAHYSDKHAKVVMTMIRWQQL
jgi:hypothetical protein